MVKMTFLASFKKTIFMINCLFDLQGGETGEAFRHSSAPSVLTLDPPPDECRAIFLHFHTCGHTVRFRCLENLCEDGSEDERNEEFEGVHSSESEVSVSTLS